MIELEIENSMCGIVGIHGHQDRDWIELMNAAQRHRGPDEQGVFRDDNAGLAMATSRLSIIDLAGGVQPMQSADKRYTLVYNGEIYNAQELRSELEKSGEKFSTDHSDTELLLRLLIRERADCLERLNGMFAFAFYDRVEGTVLCARDRMGIKPFYYSQDGGRFSFASEMKSLLKLPFISRRVDRQAFFDYLSLLYIPGQQSILTSIQRLRPGHWLKYSLADGAIEIAPWWRLTFAPDNSIPAAAWPDLIREELSRAVTRWSRSDVQVAISLSGGLDSSAIAAIAANAGMNVSAYSLGFNAPGEEEWNELPLAREVAQKWKLPLHELVLRPEAVLEALPAMVQALDEPYAGGLPSWFVFEGMGHNVKVALTGTGGDELFGNYGKWRPLEGNALRRLFTSRGKVGRDRFRKEFFERFYYFGDAAKRSVLADGGAGCENTSDVLYETFASNSGSNVRDETAMLDLSTQLPEEFLLMTDRFSMAHSVEARTPFLDNELIGLVRRIPSNLRTHRNDLKYLLRQAVAPLLPPELLTAPKRGFVIPFGRWLRGPLRPVVERLLAPDSLQQQGLFSPKFYDQYVQTHIDGRADHTLRIWSAMMFQLWHRHFIDGDESAPFDSGDVAFARG